MARPERGVPWRQTLIALQHGQDQSLVETEVCACRLQALLHGVAKVL
jgi:hypothetical protein